MLVLVLNLDRRPDRLAFMEAQFASLGVPFERVEAIDGLTGDFGPASEDITGVERACALSHRKAWRRFLETGEERCLIVEDDVVLSDRLKGFIDEASAIPAAVDVLRIETRLMRTRLSIRRAGSIRGLAIRRMRSTHFGCGAYVVSRAFAQAAVVDLDPFEHPVDHYVFGVSERCFYAKPAYQLQPGLCVQAELFAPEMLNPAARSDLEDARSRRHLGKRLRLEAARTPKRRLPKLVRKMLKSIRRCARGGVDAYECLIEGAVWRDVPFAGAGLPAALASLPVSGSQQEVQPEVQALRLLAAQR